MLFEAGRISSVRRVLLEMEGPGVNSCEKISKIYRNCHVSAKEGSRLHFWRCLIEFLKGIYRKVNIFDFSLFCHNSIGILPNRCFLVLGVLFLWYIKIWLNHHDINYKIYTILSLGLSVEPCSLSLCVWPLVLNFCLNMMLWLQWIDS